MDYVEICTWDLTVKLYFRIRIDYFDRRSLVSIVDANELSRCV